MKSKKCVSDYLCSPQHLRGDVAFSDVYELKEEVGQTVTSVRRRCLHRVTAVEYSVKVVDTKPLLIFLNIHVKHSQHQSTTFYGRIYFSLHYICSVS